jgi:hypothetical protein
MQHSFVIWLELNGWMITNLVFASVTFLSYLIISVIYEKVLWWWRESISRFWWIYTFSEPLNNEKWFKECNLSVYMTVPRMCVCTYVLFLAPERLNKFYSYSEFRTFSVTGPVHLKHERSSFKNRGPSNGQQKQNCDLSNTEVMILIIFQ